MKDVKISDLNWEKMGGLLPVITQEAGTLEVLTLAYIDREALEKSQETGWAHYYRRSHGRVMKKGEMSGNVQRITGILTDCDNDSVVYLVDQMGLACHLGERTCFHKRVQSK
jgi:phosphoribosyl-AMP cyclohydrolase